MSAAITLSILLFHTATRDACAVDGGVLAPSCIFAVFFSVQDSSSSFVPAYLYPSSFLTTFQKQCGLIFKSNLVLKLKGLTLVRLFGERCWGGEVVEVIQATPMLLIFFGVGEGEDAWHSVVYLVQIVICSVLFPPSSSCWGR